MGVGHDHAAANVNQSRIGIAALLTGSFMVAEVVGGLISGSLALLADAGHMFTDFAALSLAWFGFRIARRPADWRRTYGFERFSVLVAFVNGLSLFVIAAWIVVEAVQRIREPVQVLGPTMLVVATAGLLVNLLALWVVRGADQNNLNVRGAALHVLGDLLGSVAAIGAALIIIYTGWTLADPILSVLVALLILRSGWFVVKEAAHILLEGAPSGVDPRQIRSDLASAVDAVEDVHHVHAWSLTQDKRMLTLHARLADGSEPEAAIAAVKRRLEEAFDIRHSTVEVEFTVCADAEEEAPAAV